MASIFGSKMVRDFVNRCNQLQGCENTKGSTIAFLRTAKPKKLYKWTIRGLTPIAQWCGL